MNPITESINKYLDSDKIWLFYKNRYTTIPYVFNSVDPIIDYYRKAIHDKFLSKEMDEFNFTIEYGEKYKNSLTYHISFMMRHTDDLCMSYTEANDLIEKILRRFAEELNKIQINKNIVIENFISQHVVARKYISQEIPFS